MDEYNYQNPEICGNLNPLSLRDVVRMNKIYNSAVAIFIITAINFAVIGSGYAMMQRGAADLGEALLAMIVFIPVVGGMIFFTMPAAIVCTVVSIVNLKGAWQYRHFSGFALEKVYSARIMLITSLVINVALIFPMWIWAVWTF